MAGYMEKLQGYVYEGTLTHNEAAPVANGLLMVRQNGKLKLAADADAKFEYVGAATIYDGIPAHRFVVKHLDQPIYFVENAMLDRCECTYDNTEYTVPAGELMRAHPLVQGEQFLTTFVTGTPAVGAEVSLKADGTLGA